MVEFQDTINLFYDPHVIMRNSCGSW